MALQEHELEATLEGEVQRGSALQPQAVRNRPSFKFFCELVLPGRRSSRLQGFPASSHATSSGPRLSHALLSCWSAPSIGIRSISPNPQATHGRHCFGQRPTDACCSGGVGHWGESHTCKCLVVFLSSSRIFLVYLTSTPPTPRNILRTREEGKRRRVKRHSDGVLCPWWVGPDPLPSRVPSKVSEGSPLKGHPSSPP